MKTFFPKSLFALIAFIPVLSFASPSDTLIIVKGDIGDSKFTQTEIASYNPLNGDNTQVQLMTAAWTCSNIGHPTCNYRTLFKWDLSAIPTNSVVESVKLYLYAQTDNLLGSPGSPMYGNNNASVLRKILEPWDINNTGWDNQPSVSFQDQKTLPQSVSTVQNYIVDITDFATDWIAHPEKNNGMLMKLQNEDFYNSMIFNSGKAVDSLQPTLMIKLKTISDDTCISLIGDTARNSVFKQLELVSYIPDQADSTQQVLMTAAWTCDAIGHPLCTYRALFKYDLSSITQDAVVTSATLSLKAQLNSPFGNPGNPMFGTANSSLLQRVTAPWSMQTTGWLNQPTTSIGDQKILPQSVSTTEDYDVDITDFVQDWIAHPGNNNGMLLKLAVENYYNSMIFNAGRAADGAKPVLNICFKKGTLPVLLENFSGNLVNGNVNLYWSILDGTTLANIIVERSYDSRSFNGFTTIPAKNVTTEIKYTTTDYKVATPDGKVYYRLKMVNKDGTYKYSSILLIHVLENNNDVLLMPNPVKENFQLIFNAQNNSKSDFRILNSLGQAVDRFTYQIEVGNNSITVIPSKNLAPGLYIVQFTLDGHVITKRFLKQ